VVYAGAPLWLKEKDYQNENYLSIPLKNGSLVEKWSLFHLMQLNLVVLGANLLIFQDFILSI
jgi:hypothetical protein